MERARAAAGVGVLLALSAVMLPALAGQQAPPADPALIRLQTELTQQLGELQPPVVWEIPRSGNGQSLVVRYRTREYMVYPRAKTGRFGETLERQEGPDHDGLLIRAHVQPSGEVNQAVVPQTIREPYWTTFLNVYPVRGTGKQIYLALSFQGAEDSPLVRKAKQAAERLGVEAR